MEHKEAPGTGIYEGIDFDEYLSWDYVSNSKLALALKSLKHYKAGFTKEPTAAMRFGSLTHLGALDPLAIPEKYVVMPAFESDGNNVTAKGEPTESKATRYYRAKVAEFERVNEGKEIVTHDDYLRVRGLVESLASHELAAEVLGGSGPVECSIVWDDPKTGLRCKGRIDKWQRTVQRFADLKTTSYPPEFSAVIARYGYHRQMYFYQQGIAILTGELHTPWLVAVEPDEPWGVRSAPVGEEWLAAGRQEVTWALGAIRDAHEADEWPGYTDPAQWNPPGWYVAKGNEPMTITINGRTIEV